MNAKLGSATIRMLLLAVVGGCYVPAGSGPERLDVEASEDSTIEPGKMALLEATANGKTDGYAFRWTHEYGPEQVQILDETSPSTEAGPLNLQGEYKFRVIASTASGAFGHDFVVVTVAENGSQEGNENDQGNVNGEDNANDNANDNAGDDNQNANGDSDELIPPDRVRINAPNTLTVGQEGNLVASEVPLGFEASYSWTALAGSATFGDPTAPKTTILSEEEGVLEVEVTMTVAGLDEEFTKGELIQVVSENTFGANINGPIQAAVGEEVTLNVGFLGVSPGMMVDSTWEITEGQGELIDPSPAQVGVVPTAEGDLLILVESAITNVGELVYSGDLHLLIAQPDTSIPLEAEFLEHLAVVGEAVGVDVTAADGNNANLDFSWSFVRGQGSFDDPRSRTPNVTVTSLGTAVLEVTAMRPIEGRMHSGTLTTFVTTVNDLRPEVVIDVEGFGQIPMELDGEAAPITVANFLHYVDELADNYDEHVFNRVIADFVVQGGGWYFDGSTLVELDTRAPIPGEPDNGLSNVRGTVAMALRGGDPNSATQAFYINLVDNLHLDEDFTVFGRVSGDGMSVVDAISVVETDDNDAPIEPVIMNTITRANTEGGG